MYIFNDLNSFLQENRPNYFKVKDNFLTVTKKRLTDLCFRTQFTKIFFNFFSLHAYILIKSFQNPLNILLKVHFLHLLVDNYIFKHIKRVNIGLNSEQELFYFEEKGEQVKLKYLL